jgi:hypothetical protein
MQFETWACTILFLTQNHQDTIRDSRLIRIHFYAIANPFCNLILRTSCYIKALSGTHHYLLDLTLGDLFLMVLGHGAFSGGRFPTILFHLLQFLLVNNCG